MAALTIAALTLSACSSGAPGKNSTGQLTVVTSFYPLQFAAEQIGGTHVAVTDLTSVVSFELPPPKAGVKLVSADDPAELIRLLHEEAKVF